jgi:uncharacterized tellurite resistance protein B-like protein
MLQKLIRRLSQTPPPPQERRALAIAVLLMETARADFEHAEPELEAVRRALGQVLGLDDDEAERLMAQARDEASQTVTLHGFVGELNASTDAEGKRELIALLWQVAYADGRVDPHEEHLIRRIADLLHVPHHEFIRQKLAAAS